MNLHTRHKTLYTGHTVSWERRLGDSGKKTEMGLKDRLSRADRARLLKEALEKEGREQQRKAELVEKSIDAEIEKGANWFFVVCILSLFNSTILLAKKYGLPGVEFIWMGINVINSILNEIMFGFISWVANLLPWFEPVQYDGNYTDGIFGIGLGTSVLFHQLGEPIGMPWGILFSLADFTVIALYMIIGIYALHGWKWAFMLGMLLYLGDAVILLKYAAYDMAIFHVVVFYQINDGLLACFRKDPQPEDPET